MTVWCNAKRRHVQIESWQLCLLRRWFCTSSWQFYEDVTDLCNWGFFFIQSWYKKCIYGEPDVKCQVQNPFMCFLHLPSFTVHAQCNSILRTHYSKSVLFSMYARLLRLQFPDNVGFSYQLIHGFVWYTSKWWHILDTIYNPASILRQ